jgi:HlyD family secretion protein
MPIPSSRRQARRGAHIALLAVTWLAAPAACARGTSGDVVANGTIEAVEIDIAPMVPARVVRVYVPEGATVRAGDTLITLTQSTLAADIDRQRARLATAEATLRDLEAGARPAELDRAQADLSAAAAEADRAARDLERAEALARTQSISAQQLDQARSASSTAASRRAAATEMLRLLREGTRPERVRAARADVASARAALRMAEASVSDLVLTAPAAGTILTRNAEPGEVVGAGMAALTMIRNREAWVRVYVGELDLPRIHVGQAAAISIDGVPDSTFPGRVVSISTKAEFTPRAAMTEDERADLVFGVKVALDDSTGTLKPGLPASVRIRTGGAVPADAGAPRAGSPASPSRGGP